jgi:hypothetical protein
MARESNAHLVGLGLPEFRAPFDIFEQKSDRA